MPKKRLCPKLKDSIIGPDDPECNLPLSEQTKKDIAQSLRDYKAGRFKTLAQVKKELGIK